MKELDYSPVVKDIRQQLNLSQEELARELGVSYATISRWENGQFQPSRLARVQFVAFCRKMAKQGKVNLPDSLL